ncbi:MarR family winged helix-turn-helix transcriptional regulator [Cohnella sp. REN36]|uniref:MarR family winged helix-turn-helix transcriptional regulator n=1 Tax=Cohnella sp. REN36 TaxID=2887347 RepID=UPI001D143CD9|nr:MarR family transcriptional regulator [Cohnella sp. REN36]MCC3371893.1 MarR family transcriptional regulator [Cohnella sp. REN36]
MDDRELSLRILVVLSKAYKVITDRAVKSMKKNGLSENEFIVLELLHHKGRCPLNQIGEKILVTSGGITYTIDKLESKGCLKRVASPEDRRITYAEITDEGTKLIEEIFPAHAEVIQSMMKDLTIEEKQMTITLLKKLGFSAQASS